jgi:uncharacterized membrane protein
MPWYFVVTEFLIYGFTALILVHAWRRGPGSVATFTAASLFGFTLEFLSVRSGTDYCYGKFLVMVPPWDVATPMPYPSCTGGSAVPLWIILGWGITVYVAMATSSKLAMPWFLRPCLDALLAVNIDWIMDPLAGHLGFWTWFEPGPWFGIPLDNYFGWIVTVGGFSLLLRTLWRFVPTTWLPRWRAVVLPFLAGALGPLVVFGAIACYMAAAKAGVAEWLMVTGLILATQLPLLYQALRVRGAAKVDPLLVGVSIFFQVYYSMLLWVTGFYASSPALAIVSQATLCLAVLGYGWPYRWTTGSAGESPSTLEG